MIMATKNDIFSQHLPSYLEGSKEEKSAILKHVCFITGMHRKAAIRKFKARQAKDPHSLELRGRQEYYGADVTVALKTVWEAGGEVCGELLHPVITEYVEILRRDKMWEHGGVTTTKLLLMSEGTMKRRVGKFKKARTRKKGISDTKPSHIKHLVPIFIGPWKGKPPGYGQIDTVRHSNSARGDAVYTLNYTDAATLTPMLCAQWNKGQEATRESMKEIKAKLAFPWLGAHPDTGSEFINYMVMAWCQEETIELSRSRPNHKNDNMYVEERNGHAVRKFIGYITLNCFEATAALNSVYDVLNLYLLHFVAVRRTVSKQRLSSRYKRTYEKVPKTPYQRILEHKGVSEEVKKYLKEEHSKLNPQVMKKEIDRRIKILYAVQRRFGHPSAH